MKTTDKKTLGATDYQFESKEEFDAHTGLFMLVDGLFDQASASIYIESINDALFYYLQSEGLQVGTDVTRGQIKNLLDLNLFITTLSEQLDSISFARSNNKLKKEVSNG